MITNKERTFYLSFCFIMYSRLLRIFLTIWIELNEWELALFQIWKHVLLVKRCLVKNIVVFLNQNDPVGSKP